jgi:glycosyltransferase involved in cell wall biosynthesis
MRSDLNHSFIILAYKKSPHLEECIHSLKKQTIPSHILLSTSTPSDYLEIISKNSKIPLIINPNPPSIAADWTFAYNLCTTKYLTLAHQDDLYMPEYTEKCLEFIEKYPGFLILFSDYNELFNNSIRDNNLLLSIKRLILHFFYMFKINLTSIALKKKMLSFGNPVCCPSILYNRENIGNFEFNSSYSMNLDWDAALQLAKMKGDFLYLKNKLLTRRIHKGSESTNALLNRTRFEEDQKMFERFWPKYVVRCLLKFYTQAYKSNG